MGLAYVALVSSDIKHKSIYHLHGVISPPSMSLLFAHLIKQVCFPQIRAPTRSDTAAPLFITRLRPSVFDHVHLHCVPIFTKMLYNTVPMTRMCPGKGVGTRYLFCLEARVIPCDSLQSRELLLSEEIEITSSSLNPGEWTCLITFSE